MQDALMFREEKTIRARGNVHRRIKLVDGRRPVRPGIRRLHVLFTAFLKLRKLLTYCAHARNLAVWLALSQLFSACFSTRFGICTVLSELRLMAHNKRVSPKSVKIPRVNVALCRFPRERNYAATRYRRQIHLNAIG